MIVNALKDEPKSTSELMTWLGLRHRNAFKQNYLQPALDSGMITQTLPDKPNNRLQKYCLTAHGLNIIEKIK